jgi:hypothetical protein
LNRVPIVQGHGRSGPEGLTFEFALGGTVAVVLAVVPLRCARSRLLPPVEWAAVT